MKKKNHRIVVTIMLSLIILLNMVVPVCAETVPIRGSLVAPVISVTLPASISFVIDPNKDDLVQSAPFSFINNSTAPIVYGICEAKAADSNSLQVITAGALNWDELGRSDTEKYIAFGITPQNGNTIWAQAENLSLYENVDYYPLKPKTAQKFDLAVKCGRAWSKAKQLNYTMSVSIQLYGDDRAHANSVSYVGSEGETFDHIYFVFDESKGLNSANVPALENIERIGFTAELTNKKDIFKTLKAETGFSVPHTINFQGVQKQFEVSSLFDGNNASVMLSHDNAHGSVMPKAILHPFLKNSIFADKNFNPKKYGIREEQIYRITATFTSGSSGCYVHVAVVQPIDWSV